MKDKASLFLRIGLAFSFIYVGVVSFLDPSSWIGFIPDFVGNFIAKETFLMIHSGFDILLGVWLLSGKKLYHASIVSAAFLFGITIFNLGAIDIVFRDVSLFFAALALVSLSK